MNLFETLSDIIRPDVIESETLCSCGEEMTYIESPGHYASLPNYSTFDEGVWVEDYEIWRCDYCGKEKKIQL